MQDEESANPRGLAMVTTKTENGTIDILSREDGWALLEANAQRYLGMSAREFVDAWQAGKIPDTDRPEVRRVAALLPLVR